MALLSRRQGAGMAGVNGYIASQLEIRAIVHAGNSTRGRSASSLVSRLPPVGNGLEFSMRPVARYEDVL